MRKFTFLWILFFSFQSFAQKTFIPDDHFEQHLIDIGYDDVLDDSVMTENIITVPQLVMAYKDIEDLTGIADFEELVKLNCENNHLGELDLSENRELKYLNCHGNDLSELNLSENIELKKVFCSRNQLTNLDLSSNTNLEFLYCSDNYELGSIDLTANNLLKKVTANHCGLTTINLSGCEILEKLSLSWNSFSSIDLSSCIGLKEFRMSQNPIAEIDLSNNTALESIVMNRCDLTEISLSGLNELSVLECNENELLSMDFNDNNLLEWIQLKQNNLTEIDLTSLDDLKGIYVGHNQLSVLDISQAPNLIELSCGDNPLTVFDVSTNNLLQFIACNQLPAGTVEYLDLSDKPNLSNILVFGNSELKQVNLKTGSPITIFTFIAFNCPLLTCVEVDDVVFAEGNWLISVDENTILTESCESSLSLLEESELLISIYPNPATEVINLKSNQTGVTFSLFDITGKVIEKKTLTQMTTQIEVKHLPKGIYFIQLNGNTTPITRKIEVL